MSAPYGSRFVLAVSAVCLTAVGCYVQSLHSLATDDIAAFDAELVGTWVAEDDEEFVFTFVDTTLGNYTLLCDEGGSQARFDAVLVELGGSTFLDIYPEEPQTENGFYKDHLMRVHNVLKIERTVDTLWVADFDAEWLSTMVAQKKVAIDHVPLDGAVLLTAPTKDLQDLVRKYAKTPEAFSEPVRLRRM
ncbi:MAG TPA: hypothetical protein VEC56_11185 [Candidatus Krumholzibacteria bacterium]|nr:hypothetical protein [Candidatus Krumholzibacteria bacterium]